MTLKKFREQTKDFDENTEIVTYDRALQIEWPARVSVQTLVSRDGKRTKKQIKVSGT